MFVDRRDAGRQLAARLADVRAQQPVVLALPRGGVPVGFEIAKLLACPLDLILVRKLGAPFQPELAVGAVVGGAVNDMVLNDDVVRAYNVTPDYIERERARELAEMERRRSLYLSERAPVSLTGRTAIVVDDGVATGASMRAALRAVRRSGPVRVIAATPVAPPDTVDLLREEADEVVALVVTSALASIGAFYRDFHQLEDDEVIDYLAALDEIVARPKTGQLRA
jgi:predicted phosphoribosyltransferase